MADITASMVKELRETTGAGMMDAKNALVECNGNIEEAQDWLRKKGLAKAAKKSGRTAAEGLVALAMSADQKTAAVLEVNSETDFVARNDQFQSFVNQAANLALGVDDIAALASTDFGAGKNVQDTLTGLIATIGENMGLRRCARLRVSQGVVAGYMHNAAAENMGKIGVLVALESAGDQTKLADLGKKIAMHIAATNPEFLDPSSVSTEALDRERNVLKEQAIASGKTPDIAEKMVEGRIRKYYEEVCLTEQVFVMDGETKVGKIVENAAGDVGAPVKMTGFLRFQLGEGIEKEETDFAAEVAAAAGGR